MQSRVKVWLDGDGYVGSVSILGRPVFEGPVGISERQHLAESVTALAYEHGLYIPMESDIAMEDTCAEWVSPEIGDDAIRELGVIVTRDEKGRHFTSWSHHWDALEQNGLVTVHRPRHPGNGLWMDREHWTVEVTDHGQEIVDNHPELWPNECTRNN